MANTTLANLENFGIREIETAADLMNAYANGEIPTWFYDDGVTVEFNPYSGNVFLVNSDYQVLMFDDAGDLEGWYFLSYWGHECFISELWNSFLDGDIRPEDWEELAYYLEQEDMTEEAQQVRAAIKEEEASA